MDNKQIREIMAAMERWKIKKVMIKNKQGEELHLEREEAIEAKREIPAYQPQKKEIHAGTAHPPSGRQKEEMMAAEASSKEYIDSADYITSPMVGTYYSASSPEDSPYVKVGDRVDAETVVCIIEAMKVMNEVKAGMSGVIREVCIDNSQPVEFGTKLFRIE